MKLKFTKVTFLMITSTASTTNTFINQVKNRSAPPEAPQFTRIKLMQKSHRHFFAPISRKPILYLKFTSYFSTSPVSHLYTAENLQYFYSYHYYHEH